MIDGSRNASIRVVKGTIIIESQSGYRMLFSDHSSYHCFLDLKVESEVLGSSILRALDLSRALTIEEAEQFRSSDTDWDEWVSKMLAFTKISSQQKLFQSMSLCNVKEKDGVLVFSPTIKRRGAAWEGRGDELKTKTQREKGNVHVGETAKEVLEKCIPPIIA